MGFFFRKSVNFGPFRLNFSKSGVGASVGVKGARVSTGSRGTYVHFGSHGFYYKQRINNPSKQNEYNSNYNPSDPQQEKNAFESNPKTSDVNITNLELLNEINSKISEDPYIVLIKIICSLSVFFGLCILVNVIDINLGLNDYMQPENFNIGLFLVFSTIFIIGSILLIKAYQKDKRRRTTTLFYELNDVALERFNNINKACEILSKSSVIWRLKTFSNDRNELLDVLKEQPPYILTDVGTWSLDSNHISFYFLPDYIFVWHDKKYSAVSYESINVLFGTKTQTSDGSIPKDARIVDYVYQHTRKDGHPDRRYKYNPSFPVIEYGFIEITKKSKWSILLQVSNVSAANLFAEIFNKEILNKQDKQDTKNTNQHKSNNYRRNTSYNQQQHKQKVPTVNETIRLAHEILETSVGSTREQIINAYREMVRSYHPDKVAQSSPRIVKLAEEKMKEINAAYETLKKHKYV